MPIPWRRREQPRSRRLLAAAGLGGKAASAATDLDVCRAAAYHAAKRENAALGRTLTTVEELLLDEANYEFVLAFLEDLQNLVSHGLESLVTPAEVTAVLGPKSRVCWTTLAEFWESVGAWCRQMELPLAAGDRLLHIENEQLRALLWSANRSLPDGERLNLAHVVRYEVAGRPALPGYSHIAAAAATLGLG